MCIKVLHKEQKCRVLCEFQVQCLFATTKAVVVPGDTEHDFQVRCLFATIKAVAVPGDTDHDFQVRCLFATIKAVVVPGDTDHDFQVQCLFATTKPVVVPRGVCLWRKAGQVDGRGLRGTRQTPVSYKEASS